MLSPKNWSDKNDSFVMEKYREKKNAKYVCATCFSIESESVYHWNAFSDGSEGCQLVIKAQKFLDRLAAYHGVVHGEVEYLPVNFDKNVPLDQYPFVKRKQFACEREYRLVMLSDECDTYPISLDSEVIRSISLSDKMPKSVAESVKKIINDLYPNVDVYCSTLNDNAQWKNHFK